MPKKYVKKPHKKAKTGCVACRQRRIKCDEGKPTCSHCIRHGDQCQYSGPGAIPKAGDDWKAASPQPDLNLQDLELFHHWTMSACLAFGDGKAEDLPLWQKDVPLMACQHTFLMRGILAVSALHKAQLHPESSVGYLALASSYQALMLPEYRLAFENVTEETCTAIAMCAALVAVYTFASPSQPTPLLFTVPDWVHLHKSFVSVFPAHILDVISRGPMKRQLQRISVSADKHLNPGDERLLKLKYALKSPLSILIAEPGEIEVYEETLESLRESSALPFSSTEIKAKYALFSWIEKLTPEFKGLLAEGKPQAIVIFAHTSVLLKMSEHYWFLTNKAQEILSSAYISLDETWRPWIESLASELGIILGGKSDEY